MHKSTVETEKTIKNLTPLERHKLIIGNNLSEAISFDPFKLNIGLDLDELLNGLSEIGLEVDQEKFKQLASPFESAQGLSHYLVKSKLVNIPPYSHARDDLFLMLIDLWEFWIPERPSTEKLEDFIRLGYDFLENKKNYKCCIAWLALFPRVWDIIKKRNQKGTNDPFKAFEFTFFNWIQDLEMELWNLGLEEPFFHEQRIEIAEQYLQNCPDLDTHITENMRNALAETYFQVGKTDKANTLFENWLQDDPTWGWGWINWSDCYSSRRLYKSLDYAKAEEILKRGLIQKKVREKEIILERLSSIYKETGRADTKRISK